MSSETTEARPWYVCQTKPRQESVAEQKLSEQGYEICLPRLVIWQKKKNKWCKVKQVMFPRYAFVRCARPGQSIAPIRSTPGVTGLVTFGNVPATIDHALVVAIRKLAEDSDSSDEKHEMPFQVDDAVLVTDGPLKGVSGIVSAVARERVVVMLTLLGREKPISIPLNQLALQPSK
jgi:transcriptional antiterminator RfaH